MPGFFRRKKSRAASSLPTLYYKDGQAFFEYQCRYGHTSIEKKKAVIALVLDAQKELGTPTPISIGKDGSQLASLKVASGDGGFLVFASTPSEKGEKLTPGDIVLWVPYEYSAEAGTQMTDKRSGWIGLIRAKVKPQINLSTDSFEIACRYD